MIFRRNIATANDSTTTTYAIGLPTFGDEHCMVNDPTNPAPTLYGADWWDDDIETNTYSETYERTAQTVWHVQTGGKAVPGLLNLCQFSGSATEIVNKRGPSANDKPIPYDQIAIGGMGNLLTNGIRYNLLPNDKDFDITPTVIGKDYYTFSVGGQKYCSYFEVFVEQGNPGGVAPWGSNNVGHAWWRLSTDAPSEGLKAMGVGQGQSFAWTNETQNVFQTNMTCFLSRFAGFYPDGNVIGIGFTWTNGIQFVPGKLQCPDPSNEGDAQIKRTFFIGFPDLVNGLNFTKGMYLQPPTYSVLGYACVSAAVNAGQASRVKLPSPYFLTPWIPQTFGLLNWSPE